MLLFFKDINILPKWRPSKRLGTSDPGVRSSSCARTFFEQGGRKVKYKFVFPPNWQTSESTKKFNESRVLHIFLSFNVNGVLKAKPPAVGDF